jgi:hypothetical protein
MYGFIELAACISWAAWNRTKGGQHRRISRYKDKRENKHPQIKIDLDKLNGGGIEFLDYVAVGFW